MQVNLESPAYATLEQRRKQFINWVDTILPDEKKDWVEKMANQTLIEFIAMIKARVIPFAPHQLNLVVDVILSEGGVARADVDTKKLEKLVAWLKCFAEYIEVLTSNGN